MSNADELAKFANSRASDRVNFDNAASGLVATNVKTAIDELALRTGLAVDPVIRITNFIAEIGKIYKLNSTAGAFDITMPTSPAADVQFGFVDVSRTLDTNAVTLKYNGTDLIQTAASDKVLNIKGLSATLIFSGSAFGWSFFDPVVAAAVTGYYKVNITPKTSNFTALLDEINLVDTTSGTIDITLPTSPTVDDKIAWMDFSSNFATNKAILKFNATDKIMGLSEDNDLDLNNFNSGLVYTGSSKGWMYL